MIFHNEHTVFVNKSGLYKDKNTSSRVITEVKHLELKQFSD